MSTGSRAVARSNIQLALTASQFWNFSRSAAWESSTATELRGGVEVGLKSRSESSVSASTVRRVTLAMASTTAWGIERSPRALLDDAATVVAGGIPCRSRGLAPDLP